jgi:probable selenium-dependent hydroxylase accessory protein YqeC
MSAPPALFELLAARHGIVCAVGAGGKKSVLYALAAEHPGRVAITGTVPFVPPPESLTAERITGDAEAIAGRLAASGRQRTVVFVLGRPPEKKGRWGGLPPELIRAWHGRFGFDLTLVKADGARMRWIKAPAEDEPLLPPGCSTLIPILSARALGEPLSDRIAHRVALVEQVSGCRSGEIFQPEHAARLLSSPRGLLQGAGDSEIRPVINMVDDPEKLALARQAAVLALEFCTQFDQVVLTRLKERPAVVEIVRRARAEETS